MTLLQSGTKINYKRFGETNVKQIGTRWLSYLSSEDIVFETKFYLAVLSGKISFWKWITCIFSIQNLSLFNFEYLYFFIQKKIKIPAISAKNFYKGRNEISKKPQGGTTSSKLLFYGIFTCFQIRVLNLTWSTLYFFWMQVRVWVISLFVLLSLWHIYDVGFPQFYCSFWNH